jgi:two-component system, LytTR family, response regulator
MKALIIDDEQHCIDSLSIMIEKHCPMVQVVQTCMNGICGLESIYKHEPDLVFLDIAMPRMNGFDMLARLHIIDFEIIFTTAYDNYAIQAFKVSAADYLLKPVDKNELVRAVETVAKRLALKNNSQAMQQRTEQMHMLLENLQQGNMAFPKIALPTMGGLEIVNEEDILYLEGDGNYVHVHRKTGKPLMVSKTIKFIEERLHNKFFFRVHNSYLVNLREVVRYLKGDGGSVVMSNGVEIQVSKSRKPELFELLKG